MRDIISPLSGFGSPFGQRRRAAQIITAVIAPALGPLTDGDTIASALSADIDQTSNYASTAGTISAVDVVITVNGDPALASDTVDFEDVVAVTVTVTDSEANERVFTLERTVAGIAPTNDVAPAIAGDTGLGDTLTVTAGTWSGAPAPTLAYQWLRGGVEIAGETGTTYDITLADSGASITVRETATNSEGSAFEVSNAITADVFTVPDAFTSPDWDVANDGDTVSVNVLTLPADGGAAITDLGYRVNGGTAVSLGETTTGSYPITADEGDDIEIRAVNAIGAGGWSDVKAVPSAVFDPLSLFAGGENGAFFDLAPQYLFQDDAGTTPVTAPGQPVGFVTDRSGNGNHATQATVEARPEYLAAPDRLKLDQVDDNMAVDFGAAFTGTVFQGTPSGVIHYDIDVPSGNWNLTVDERYVPDNGEITGLIPREGSLTSAEAEGVKAYLRENGAGGNFGGVTSMERWFQDRDDITAIYAGDWDTSSVTSFSRFALNSSNLTTLDVSNWDTSSVVNGFRAFVSGCSSLAELDVSNWDTSSVTNFREFAQNCSSLTTLDVSNWDTSSVTVFLNFARFCSNLTTVVVNGGTGNPFADSPCKDYEDAFTGTNLTQQSIDDILVAIELAGTSGGTFDQSGGSAPSATGEAAIDALRGRGWSISVTGGY